MHVLVIAGVLALAGAQTTVDPSVLISIFGTPPTTRQPLEEVPRHTRNVKVDGLPTTKPSLLLTEVFGNQPTRSSARQRREEANLKRSPRGTRSVKVDGGPTIKPSVLAEVFGTPPTANSPRQRYEDASSKREPQGTRNVNVDGLPPIKPSLLTEGSTSTQPHKDPQDTRLENIEGLPTIAPSVLIDIFGTPSTYNSWKWRCEDITVKPTEGTATFVDREGQSCQCVPYYLCDANNVGVDVNNASVTGSGTLDIRFGDDDTTIDRKCQESVEVCCVIPKDPSEMTKPQPDPTKVKGCGYRNPQGLGVTFTGGASELSQFGEFPWVVALLDNHNASYVGVGALIHPQVVMTGAHIAQKFGPGGLRIRAGEWDTQTVKEIFPYEERTVQTTVIHENFMPKSLKNDIALLMLDSALEITEHINVICMPDQEEVFDSSKNCVANGWGKTKFSLSNRYAVILKKVEQDMVPYSRCNALLKRTRLGHNFQLHNSFVCAGGEAGKDTCQGDGGAPLVCPIGNNRYKLTGLVAWGIGCGEKDVPAVYTNVPLFRHWVDDKLADWGLEATSYRISK